MAKKATSKTAQQAQAAGAKTPEDFKEKVIPFNQVEGHELLIPLDQIDIEDGLELINVLEGSTSGTDDISITEIAKLIKIIRTGGFVADEEGFKAFAHMGNMEKTLNLVTSYIGELSKDIA